MVAVEIPARKTGIMPATGLNDLISALRTRGYRILGPRMAEGAIVIAEMDDGLPSGWTARQEAGSYRLERRDDEAVFGYAVGPHSWKRYLFPPERLLWSGRVEANGRFELHEPEGETRPTAFLGVRACDIAAIEVQDRVFMGGKYVDEGYRRRREQSLIVAVNCTEAASTCFCSSTGTGPQCTHGFDLALTEMLSENGHDFLVEAGTPTGEEIFEMLPLGEASADDIEKARSLVASAARGMTRKLDAAGAHDLLLNNLEHPIWDEIAERCLACANCTMVCPTCFCSTVKDTSDLSGREVERHQVWDSCFTAGHSYLHGGSVHSSIKSRYRQWLTHKLATWIDQFGTSGCVGCGRCITWCPAAIDLTREVARLAEETT